MTSSATSSLDPDLEQLARRFPLVPRYRPPLPPFPQQLAEITDLAATPTDHPDHATRIAVAHNKAALIASNCRHPDLARRLCWQHHHRYTSDQPWTAIQARRALEPVVNLARLHIRAGKLDTAVEMLESLLFAAAHSDVVAVESEHLVDFGSAFITAEDRDTIRRWLWTVTLAEGLRALARAGRWCDALDHARRHNGIGDTLLDGRQVAILAHLACGDHTTAITMLTDTVLAEPWQEVLINVLGLILHRAAGWAPSTAAPAVKARSLMSAATEGVFEVETRLTLVELVTEPTRSATLIELIRTLSATTDGAIARTVLTHDSRRHLPHQLIDQITTLDNLAAPRTTRSSLQHELVSALTQSRAL